MTAPAENHGMLRRLLAGASRGLRVNLGAGSDEREAKGAAERAELLGVQATGWHSTDEEIAEWEQNLWDDQEELVLQCAREWLLGLLYDAGEQFITWHKEARQFLRRVATPGRIRSCYNITHKAVKLRVARLTENKPAVTVQALTVSQEDVDRAELKENLWWSLWNKLSLHQKIGRARRWATKCASGFLKVGWDPFAGEPTPATRKIPRYAPPGPPMQDPATGQLIEQAPVLVAIDEVYVDRLKNPLGPVEETVEDPDHPGKTITRRLDPPKGTAWVHDGEAFVDVRAPFNLRWDRYTDDPHESWYMQDSEVMPTSTVLGLFPDAIKVLQEAKNASENEKLLQWQGLLARAGSSDAIGRARRSRTERNDSQTDLLERDYVVRETWIWPLNDHIRKLWGKNGARLITVGGKLVKKSVLPKWALKARPFIQFVDEPEEGNHYGRLFLRDLFPLQDDINRSRSMKAEGVALRERLILATTQNHQMRLGTVGEMPGVLITVRERNQVPTVLQLGAANSGLQEFYLDSVAAAADLGNMNDASTGKLPSAGIAAKAIYALQYADEKSVTETSALQDIALNRLAKALDAVTRVEYTEARTIQLVGDDRSYLVEFDVRPEDLDVDVDYDFVPGSMLSRQKEAIKNELLALKEAGLASDAEVRRFMPTAIPELARNSNGLQYSRARRVLQELRKGKDPGPPQEWDDPIVHLQVLEDALTSASCETLPTPIKQAIAMRWQYFRQVLYTRQASQRAAQAAARQPPAGGTAASAAPIGGTPAGQMGPNAEQRAARINAQMEAAVQEMPPPA